MVNRIYDPGLLAAQGALISYDAIARQRGGLPAAASMAAVDRSRHRGVFLRWQTSPIAGLPSEPFKVWRRPALPPTAVNTEVAFKIMPLTAAPFSLQCILFTSPVVSVRLRATSANGGMVKLVAFAGAPIVNRITAVQQRTVPPQGSAEFEIHAPWITSVTVTGASTLQDIRAFPHQVVGDEKWELLETVGLPVHEGDWAGIGQSHGIKQGLVGAEKPALDAAVERFARGVNPLGWGPTLPGGAAAPAWEMPDPALLVKESHQQLLPLLRQVATDPPDQQVGRLFQFTIDPPSNPASGATLPADQPAQADLSPIGLLAMTVTSDPMLAVVLGYGTGYEDVDLPPMVFADRPVFNDPGRSDWDYLVTGLWRRGLDGKSAPLEVAALVPRPALALPAPVPADLHADFQGHLRPAMIDDPWLATVRASWERFPSMPLASVASFAFARRTGGTTEALMSRRTLTTGHRPIGDAHYAEDPEPTRQSATDSGLPIPNAPGSVSAGYAVATQNIFGIWSAWAAAGLSVSQPAPAPVQFLAAELHATDPGSGTVCPATLTLELSVDWQVRSIARIELRGRLFPAATRHAPAPAGPAPAGIQKQLGAPASPTHILFAGNVPALAGASVDSLSPDGASKVAPGPAGQSSSRRYRVSLPGFVLDYATTPHIGLKLEARLVERIAPQRAGQWSPVARLAYASDPRARPTTVVDVVRLASLPDASGECHARIDWNAVPGAAGYAVYESTETRILASHDQTLPQPTPERTLSERLTTLKNAFAASPSRHDFARRNAELITETGVDVTLPRGSRDIHVYTVLPVMAGGNEGPWPGSADALIPYAAPRVAEPAPPTIEAQLLHDRAPAPPNYRVRVRIGTRGSAGAHPRRIDVYRVRVDDAARRLDSMGPPIASVSATDANWTVKPSEAGGWIDSVVGIDQPQGSWRTVWYRAVAWSEDDPLRGVRKGRSAASPAVSVVVPPADPPDMSPLVISWPGGDPAAVLLSFSSTAPVAPTPLGPHRMTVAATTTTGASLVGLDLQLEALPVAEPATGSGVWREEATPGAYRILLRRASIHDAMTVIVRITDPLGRVAERTATIAPESVMPLPTLSLIDRISITGRGTFYLFSTNAPDQDESGQDYRLRVELMPASTSSIPMPGPLPIPPRGPDLPGRGQPAGGTQFRLIKGVYVFDEPLASVATSDAKPGLEPQQAMVISRRAAPLRDQFIVSPGIALRGIRVRIQTPDGRTVERSD